MLGFTKQPKRFSLLLLEEGEYYFDDFSAFYYPAGEPDDQALKKRIKGRIKMCSHSVMFEPDEIKLPIMKFPFRHTTSIDESTGPLKNMLIGQKTELFSIKCNITVEMKENNSNAPYVFRDEKKEHRFSLNYVALTAFLPRLLSLLALTKLPPGIFFIQPCKLGKEVAEAELKQIIDEKESTMSFNISHIEDINEKILFESTGIQVFPLINNPGKILITNLVVYFQPFNNVFPHPVDKYKIETITRVAKRRFILRHVGIEIFMKDGQSIFFAFKNQNIRDQLYEALLRQPSIAQSISSEDQSNMTLKWQNGVISNYEYLIYLNSLAGRSYNDITQYPVFPWILADYTSKTLDLNKPSTFRDLSKPIGALNPERLKMYRERMGDTPDGQPKFLYGTHYSTPGYVLFYLVREAPEFMLRLQNGKFDAPGRMFHSIAETWWGVLNNPADVKELIPEFYAVSKKGSFMLNMEHLNLGTKHDGVRIDDVVLPPWAENAEDFVKKLNEALESEYVSEHLHEWIDLIFGYKQQGKEALKADNVFYHLTYEGAVDIDSIKDPQEKAAIIAQIREFGQTPKQIFSSQHAQRLPKHARSTNFSLNAVNSIPVEVLDVESLLAPLYPTWGKFDNLDLDFSFKLHKDVITASCLSKA